MIKNLPEKTKILCAIGISLFVLLICIFAIFKCFNTSSSVNETEHTTNDNSVIEQEMQQKDLITTSGYEHLYNFLSTGDVNNIYGIDGNEYSILISGESNSIVVNDSTIFKSNQELYTVDLYRDIFIIYTASDSSDFKSTLYLIGLEGNIIKKVDNVILQYRNFYQDKISYVVDNYDYGKSLNDNVIYKYHSSEHYMITYLGNSQISEEIDEHSYYVYTPECISGKMCLLYEQDGLKIEIGYKTDIDQNGNEIRLAGLFINGSKVDKAYNLLNLSFLPDGYLFITSSYQDGYTEYARIIDWNGNIVTDFNDVVGSDYYTSHPLISGVAHKFSDGIFTINTVSGEAQSKIGTYFSVDAQYPDDYVIGKVFKFNYLGNGLVDDGYVEDVIDLGDFRNYYESKSN